MITGRRFLLLPFLSSFQDIVGCMGFLRDKFFNSANQIEKNELGKKDLRKEQKYC